MGYYQPYLLPLLLGAIVGTGTYLLMAGWRIRIRLAPAHCARCGYDVRGTGYPKRTDARCPECGSELGYDGAVSHASRDLSYRVLGAGLLVLVMALAITRSATPSPVRVAAGLRTMPSARPPATRPDTRAESREYWASLEAALSQGTLTSAQVDTAIRAFAASLRQPLGDSTFYRKHYADQFVAKAYPKGLVAPESMEAFLEALLEGEGKLRVQATTRPAVNVDLRSMTFARQGIHISCRPGNDSFSYSFRQVFCLREIRDGEGRPVGYRSSQANKGTVGQTADLLSSASSCDWDLNHWLLPGSYDLEFVFDVGAVPDSAIPRGINGTWGAARKWPAPGRLWEYRYRCTLVIPDARP